MSGSLIPNGKQQYLDANGKPLAGGKVYYYIPSTTTPKNTYQDAALTILNSNPIVLDSAGECIAYGSGAYRQIVNDVNDNIIWDQPTYPPITLTDVTSIYSAPNGSSLIGYNEGGTGAVNRTVQAKLQESVSVKDFGAMGDGTTDDTTAIQAAINLNRGVFIPSGTYKTTSTLTLNTKTYIYGEGTSSVINYTGSGYAISSTSVNVGDEKKTISNFRIQSSTASVGIYLLNEYHVSINNMYIYGNGSGCTTAAILLDSTGSNNTACIDIFETVIQYCHGNGIQFAPQNNVGPAAVLISGNRIQANNGWGILCSGDISVEATILSNDIEGNTLGGIKIDYLFCCHIIGNHLEYATAVTPLQLGGTGAVGRVYSSMITGNNIATTGDTQAVILNSFINSIYSNNYVTGYTSQEVYVSGSTGNSTINRQSRMAMITPSLTVGVADVSSGSAITAYGNSALGLVGSSGISCGDISFRNQSNTGIWKVHADNTGFFIALDSFSSYAQLNNPPTAWSFTSDSRLKENITNSKYGLNEILSLRPVEYNFKNSNIKDIGFIAQEVKDIIPYAISGTGEEYLETDTLEETIEKTLKLSKDCIIPILVKAIQELKTEIDLLKTKS
jgi:hypothetical protein